MTAATDPPIRFGSNETTPGSGAYLVLWYHHDGESHWCTLDQLRERIRVIRESKPDVDVRLARLTAVPWSRSVAAAEKAHDKAVAAAGKAYDEVVASAWKADDEAVASALKAYDEAMAPAQKAFLKGLHIRKGNAVRLAACKPEGQRRIEETEVKT